MKTSLVCVVFTCFPPDAKEMNVLHGHATNSSSNPQSEKAQETSRKNGRSLREKQTKKQVD